MSTPQTRWLPVIGVLVAAPWFAEMSWGGYPFTDIPLILLFLAPMYGGAALLIHELARRTGRSWPTILLLAAAFGVLQAGLVDQSLFNPAYDRFDFQYPVHVDGIDISLYYLLAFVAGHVVASIGAPILLAETWSRHGREPWLSRRALWVVALLYALATVVNHFGVKDEVGHGFQAAPVQMLAAAVTVLLLVAVAVTRSRRTVTDSRIPAPWMLTVMGFLAYLLYLPGENAAAFVFGVVLLVAAVAAIGTWSRSRRWTEGHTVGLAIGTVLTGTVSPFWSEPYKDGVSATSELIADTGAAAICLTIVVATVLRHRAVRRTKVTAGP